jgi:hypothetical protein
MAAPKYSVRKFDGDDRYSWAVFKKEDLKGLQLGVIFYGQAQPIVCGCSRDEANYHKEKLEKSS